MVCFQCLPDVFSIYGTDDNVFLHQPLTSQMESHKKSVRQIWLTHYIFFMRLVADNSLNYMHISEINFMSTWFIYTRFCNWHMFKWFYLIRTTLSAVCVLGAKEPNITVLGITTLPLYWVTGYQFLSFQTILFDFSIAGHLGVQWHLFPQLIGMISLTAHRPAVIYLYFGKQRCPETGLTTTKGKLGAAGL